MARKSLPLERPFIQCASSIRHKRGAASPIAFLVWFGLAVAWQPSTAQTVIGGTAPDSSAVLDIQSTSHGVLFPRLSTTQRDAIANPAEGLMIYNTTTKCLEINLGMPVSPSWIAIKCPSGSVSALDCANAVVTGTLTGDSTAAGVSVKVPYTGGNGGPHDGQTVNSTGVTGLTATLASGSFSAGDDSLSYDISGTPDTAGTASFALNIGGQSCTLEVTVEQGVSCTCCAKVSATEYKDFMCHNLASANTSADPFTPSWEIIGGYWQWGRLGPDSTQWLNTNTANFAHGPTGSGASPQTNEAVIASWSGTNASNGAWSDASKTANDPCPAGYRVPTKTQWEGVIANNTLSVVGTWNNSPTNYSSGRLFGPRLFLPAAGYRASGDGELRTRGFDGNYWSSTESGTGDAHYMLYGDGSVSMSNDYRRYGHSIRCIAE